MEHLPEQLTDNPAQFKALIQRPNVAWPTVMLFVVAWTMYIAGTYLALSGQLPPVLAIAINALAVFWLFSVFHDASHSSVCQNRKLNDWFGRVSIMAFTPLPVFKIFRFVHMQHHRFSNEADDPDFYCGSGPRWSLPLRWASLDLHYYYWYLPRLFKVSVRPFSVSLGRPVAELRDALLTLAVSFSLIAAVLASGWGMELLLYWLLPARIAIFFLALAFDYLPHAPYKATDAENKYQATSVRAGWEWLLTPLLLSQNYHLVHHLYPLVPFYRYVKVWRSRERFHLEQTPLMLSPVSNRELTQSEYLALRGL